MARARQRARRGDSMTVSGGPSRAAEGAKAVVERAALSRCTARRRRPFPAPKVDMLGSGGCSGWSPILVHITFQGAANERPQFTPLGPVAPHAAHSDVAVGAALEASRACDAVGLGQYIMMQLRFPKIGWVR